MSVFSIYVISESGSLQYSYDHAIPLVEVEKSYNYPLPFTFKMHDGYLIVDFGAKDEIKIGYAVLSINGIPAKGAILEDGREILQVY
ncbi:unnamed protein product [Protopolystoma xenopodis]|uniref:Uncharacterized protein n=1 Tax=Protopolystoma xenopodis TaxID=117903 RepID=A0A3S5CG49_9PLAT|nr:unnamed protein product [Protopolystoma xenopodis]